MMAGVSLGRVGLASGFAALAYCEYSGAFWQLAITQGSTNVPGFAVAAAWLGALFQLVRRTTAIGVGAIALGGLVFAACLPELIRRLAIPIEANDGLQLQLIAISADVQQNWIASALLAAIAIIAIAHAIWPTFSCAATAAIGSWAVLSIAWPALPGLPGSAVLPDDLLAGVVSLAALAPFAAYCLPLPSIPRHAVFCLSAGLTLTAGPTSWMFLATA